MRLCRSFPRAHVISGGSSISLGLTLLTCKMGASPDCIVPQGTLGTERGAHPQDSDLMVSTGALRHTRAQDVEPDPLSVLKHRAWNRLERNRTESKGELGKLPTPPHCGSGGLLRDCPSLLCRAETSRGVTGHAGGSLGHYSNHTVRACWNWRLAFSARKRFLGAVASR